MVTTIESPQFGPVAMIEIGATNVGRIRQMFIPGRDVAKGEEKGLFAVGGSCVKPAAGTMAVFQGPGRGIPNPPKSLPPNRVAWPPMPKIDALVAFQPKFNNNGTGGFNQVLVMAT